MARIRSIKPEFFSSEQVVSVGPWARLLFQGLWVFGDDEGRGKASAIELKAKVFPADPLTPAKVEAMLQELVRAGLVVLYVSGGVRYWAVPGFKKHQCINRPQPARYPPPPGSGTEDAAPITDRSVIEHASAVTVPQNGVTDHSLARVQIQSLPIHDPIPSGSAPEGGRGEPAEPVPRPPLAGWGRHLTAVPPGALPEPWRCVEAAFAAWYRQRRRAAWKATASTGKALATIAELVAETARAAGTTEEAAIDRALGNFGADAFAQSADYPPSLLATKWGAYWDPPAALPRRGAMHPCPPQGAHDDDDLTHQLGLEEAVNA